MTRHNSSPSNLRRSSPTDVDLFTHLATEHRELLAELKALHVAVSPVDRENRWADVRAAILAHERAKELVLNAALRRYDHGAELVAARRDAQATLGNQVAEVGALPVHCEAWRAGILRLEQNFAEHAEDEHQFFLAAKSVLGPAQSTELTLYYLSTNASIRRQLGLGGG